MAVWKPMAGLGVALALASPAWAGNCASRAAVVERLQTKHAEELAMAGLQGTAETGAMVEVWASRETGTFTVLVTQPNGITCIVATGTDFFSATGWPETPKGVAG